MVKSSTALEIEAIWTHLRESELLIESSEKLFHNFMGDVVNCINLQDERIAQLQAAFRNLELRYFGLLADKADNGETIDVTDMSDEELLDLITRKPDHATRYHQRPIPTDS